MKHILWSRRNFLKTSTGALLTVPTIIPSSVFGSSQAASPSERVTLGHIGVGGRGTDVQKEFQKLPSAQCVAVCDPFRSKREERAAAIDQFYTEKYGPGTYKGCSAYNDFRELLAREDIEAVVIATPDHWHVPIALEAVRAGKDVYVEKPLGLSFEQNRILRQVVNRYGAVFQYGTQQRSSRNFRYACELVRNGRIGKLHTMHVWCALGGAGGSVQPEPVPEGFDYDLWLGPAPFVPYTVDRCRPGGTYWILPYSIGYIAGWGVHPLDIAQWGNNSDHTAPVEYEGTGTIPSDGLYDVIDSWDMTLRYADGVVVRFVSSDRVRPLIESYRGPNDHGTTFIGDKGWVSVDRGGLYADPPSLLNSEIGTDELHLYESNDHWQNFIDCIRSRKETICPIDTAVKVDTISHLCDIAIRLNRKIQWDPVNERILGDSDAERMLKRPMRPPWTL